MTPYVTPRHGLEAFNCPRCQAYANMRWRVLLSALTPGAQSDNNPQLGQYMGDIVEAECAHCKKSSYWIREVNFETSRDVWKMLWPDSVPAPLPHDEMPDDTKQDYMEARSVVAKSPRAAAALLRLAIQKLCRHLGGSGENINADIGVLVDRGLPVQVQQSLDAVRVIGNNAVHPGEMSMDDVAKVALTLFEIVNFIVDDRIAKPRRLAEIYEGLPGGALDGIKKRDS